MIKSYRSRLVFYSTLLMVFLSGVVTYSYLYIYDLVINETETHIERLTQSTASSLADERFELERYVEVIANDLRLREYMFIVTQVGGESVPLRELYERNFASLPIDSILIVDAKKNLLVGDDNNSIDYVLRHFPAEQHDATTQSFYMNDDKHFELVATAKVNYRDNHLGYIAITRHVNSNMLKRLRERSGGHIFVSHNNVITLSTLQNAVNKPFILDNRHLDFSDEIYRTNEVRYTEQSTGLPKVWLGLPETQLIDRLHEHRTTIFTVLITGVISILLTGMLLIRNFHQPLSALMRLTREIGQGNLPQLKKMHAQNEIDELANHFVDMVTALKEKQVEVEHAHEALRQSAITDSLTGLHNRRYLQMVFPKMLAQASREHKYLGAIIVDLDHFKQINDTYGHLAGDICLASFADELRDCSRVNDDLFRLGGEEFLILTISEDITGIKTYAEKLRATIESNHITYQGQEISLTISAGISVAAQNSDEQEVLKQLLMQADEALYQAKNEGRNSVVTSSVVPHTTSRSRQLN